MAQPMQTRSEMLQQLAASRRARIERGAGVSLTSDEIYRSTQSAMRLADASCSAVAEAPTENLAQLPA